MVGFLKFRVQLVVALVVLGLAWWWWSTNRSMVYRKSYITGKEYFVKNMGKCDMVADRLAELEVHLRKFLNEAAILYPEDPLIKNIRTRWSGTLAETPENSKDIAYSVSKDSIFICIRTEDGQGVQDFNTAVFVLIHELAHVGNNSWGHNHQFWASMRTLLEMAEATGFYTYQDFGGRDVVTFCNRQLGSSPLTCIKNGQCRSMLEHSPAHHTPTRELY